MEMDPGMLRRLNLISDPIRLCFKESTDKKEAKRLYAWSWDCHKAGLQEKIFSRKIDHFSRAFAYARMAIKTDPNYECAKTSLLLTSEILDEMGVESGLGFSISNSVNPEDCLILMDSYDFLQQLQSGEHNYCSILNLDGENLFDSVRNSLGALGYTLDVERERRKCEIELYDLGLKVFLSGGRKVAAMKVFGEDIAAKLKEPLKDYQFRML